MSRNLLADASSNLADAAGVVIIDDRHFDHMVLHGQFSVQMKAEITDDSRRLNLGRELFDVMTLIMQV